MPSKTLAVRAFAPVRLTLRWLESDQHVRLVLGFRIGDEKAIPGRDRRAHVGQGRLGGVADAEHQSHERGRPGQCRRIPGQRRRERGPRGAVVRSRGHCQRRLGPNCQECGQGYDECTHGRTVC